MPKLNRRHFLAATAATVGVTSKLNAADRSANPDFNDLIANLRNPPTASQPHIRWWWPGAAVDPRKIAEEAAIIADAGFGGFEIADVRDGVTVPIDPKTQGWGSPAWINAVEAALEVALARGITPSITLGPHWPTGVPGVRPDDDAAAKELVHGVGSISGGQRFDGSVPPPLQAKPSGTLPVQNENPAVTPVLLAVQAMRLVEDGPAPMLDPVSLIDLTPKIRNGKLSWRAPKGGEWRILSFWMRGTGQIQNMFGMNKTTSMLADPVPYVLDIYGPAAVQALTRYWEKNLLPERTRQLMRKAGGTFFEDSLELSMACPWTPNALAEFSKRRSYDLTPYLALLVSRQPTFEEMIGGGGRPQLFNFEGVDAKRVRHDFDSMQSGMYVEHRLKGLSTWAAKLGMKFRVQAIGSEINAGVAAAYADIPEGDNSNDIHGWRKLAAGRDIGGKSILSDEAGTFVKGMAHVATWKDLLYMLQRDMAGGANQIVLHGFSHAQAPGAVWPGYSAFGRSIGNDWGPRDPNWTMAKDVTTYIARLQHLLRLGRTQADLAVLGVPLKSQAVLHAGYTFQYPAMELFDLPKMTVKDGRLMPDGPAYRAIVLNALDEIDLAVAKRLLAHARARLPVIIIGDLPRRSRGWLDAANADREIDMIMQSLLALPGVRQVHKQSDVPAALAALGVNSTIQFSAHERIIALRRKDADTELLYLLNDSEKPTNQILDLEMSGIPHQVDLWTGEIAEVTGWQRRGKAITLPLSLAPNEPTIILVSANPIPGARKTSRKTSEASGPKKSLQLGPWDVALEDWRPSPTHSTTIKEKRALKMEKLVPWAALPGGKGIAGTARYRTAFKLPSVSRPQVAYLDLGAVGGTASISVNGSKPHVVNPFTQRAEITALLKPGPNTIEIGLASPLNNRLLANRIEEQGFKPPVGEGPPPPPPPSEQREQDPDLIDGPGGGMGMQPGAAPPGGKREYLSHGLMGPVLVHFR